MIFVAFNSFEEMLAALPPRGAPDEESKKYEFACRTVVTADQKERGTMREWFLGYMPRPGQRVTRAEWRLFIDGLRDRWPLDLSNRNLRRIGHPPIPLGFGASLCHLMMITRTTMLSGLRRYGNFMEEQGGDEDSDREEAGQDDHDAAEETDADDGLNLLLQAMNLLDNE